MEIDTHSWVLWVGVIAAALHVMEEHAEGWTAWANETLGPRFGVTFTETNFFLTNTALIFIALAGAAIGWWAPALSLAVPALFVINAVFFHMVPSARDERLTPGTLSAVFIYLPVAAWMFWAAGTDGHLGFGTVFLAFLIGAAIMAYPLLVLVLEQRIGWEAQTAAAATSGTRESRPEEPTFEETPPEQVEDQIEAQPAESDDGTATAVLVSDPETTEPRTEPGSAHPQVEPETAEHESPPEDETTELRRD